MIDPVEIPKVGKTNSAAKENSPPSCRKQANTEVTREKVFYVGLYVYVVD